MSIFWERPCQQFSLDAIQDATDNFDESKVIGKGGFGKVYKALIDDETVAVKRLTSEKQGDAGFSTEIKMLSKFRHCHMVSLVGYCDEPPEKILVYEFMSNGTLADHLHKNQNSSLTWERRLKTPQDYLHTGTGISDRVIHLDVKCANILLDENWAAKIADLGLSKTGPANQIDSEVIADHVCGTRGYIDPHYRKSHKFSRKADTYAFGMVLLEVLTGTRALGGDIIPDPEITDLAHWAQQHIRNRTPLNRIIDPSVIHQIEPKCLEIFANTMSRSFHNDPKKRPTMSKVVAQLESALAFQEDTNPSSSSIQEDVFRNEFGIESRLETRLDRVSENNEESSDVEQETAKGSSPQSGRSPHRCLVKKPIDSSQSDSSASQIPQSYQKMEGSSCSVNSQANKKIKRKWTLAEDSILISCMVDLRNMGTHNVDTGFKSGYLPELEKILWEKLPDCGLKARPHIESRLKTLKKDWSIVYDMMYGPHTSGFGWDVARKMVTAEDNVWDAYIASYKDAAPFRTRSFPHFEELSLIYAKDRATRKDAQAVEDILEEMDAEDMINEGVPNANTQPEDTSRARPPTREEIGSTCSRRKRKKNQTDLSTVIETMNTMAFDMKEACVMLSKSVHSDIVQENLLELPSALRSVDGLTAMERRHAIRKFGKNPNDVLLFFGTDPEDRLEMVKDFIENE